MLGSNYGREPDPNAIRMAEYFQANNIPFYVVEELRGSGAVSVLERGSWDATWISLTSRACFYTHSFSDVIPYGHRFHLLWSLLKMPTLVFMQHGVIGFKKKLSNGVPMSKYINTLSNTFDWMLVSSEPELELISSMGVPRAKLTVTGMPAAVSSRIVRSPDRSADPNVIRPH